jgi:hypothetical protein
LMAATPLSKRDAANPPKPVGELVAYAVEDGEPPDSFPQFVRNKILSSREFDGKAAKGAGATGAKSGFRPPRVDEEDSPF